ncbi:hypothetical protein [Helicobacter vulpis]|uniref:hypothetical protein n=1 Tax=Helicobacter vulpis TaxID=2316076 RepID=UPI000EB35BA2|nr:hypothetical protein [Helicobacter vulpis]
MQIPKEKLKTYVGVFVAFALVLSVAQNIHYFFKYRASVDTMLVVVAKNPPEFSKKELESALDSPAKSPSTSTQIFLQDLIKEAQKQGIAKKTLLLDLRSKIE